MDFLRHIFAFLARIGSGTLLTPEQLNVAITLSVVLAVVGLAALIFYAVGRRLGPVPGAAAALACWLNPAVLLHGAVLGYIDPLFAVPAIAALIVAAEGSGWAAGALLALACLTRPLGLLMAPAVGVALWRRRGGDANEIGRAVVGGGLLAGIWVAPFVAAGTFANGLSRVTAHFSEGVVSGNAANLWWIGTWVAGVRAGGAAAATAPVHPISSPAFLARMGAADSVDVSLGLAVSSWILVGLVVGWAMWRARRADRFTDFAAVAAFTVHAYFVLALQVQENHLFLALPLLTIIAARERRYRPLLVAVSAIALLNLNFFYGLGRDGGYALPRMATGVDATVLLAAANGLVLLWHARLFFAQTTRRPATLDMLRAHLRGRAREGIGIGD